MAMVEVVFAACTALAMVGGFVFEWRRQGAQDARVAALETRCETIEGRVTAIENWRDRVGRSW